MLALLSRALSILSSPAHLRRCQLRRDPSAPFLDKLAHDALDRPHFAYGLYHAALQARQLNIPAVSAIEFGVAGGAGLLVLEQHADAVERETGTRIKVFGFDTNTGMPPARDHRDMPYVWTTGLFAPQEDFRARLRRSTFITGDVAQTVPAFAAAHSPPPLGFIAFDLDYYTSTVEALKLFDLPAENLLPRVMCYMDDIIGDDHELHSRFTGELLAIDEFNAAHETRKIAPIHALRHKRRIQAPWNDQIFAAHVFDHPLYNQYTNPRWK